MKLQWLGHSCFIIDDRNRIVIDPFITGNPVCPVTPEEVHVDIVTVTHGHGDHLGDAIIIAENNDAPLIAIHEIAAYAATHHIATVGMNIGGTINIKETDITMVPAWHSSGIDETNHTISASPAGFIIDSGMRVYHAGDTGLFSDMKLINTLFRPKVALLPIGDCYTMGPMHAAIAAEWIGANTTIPMHYNTFEAIQIDPAEFKHLAEQRGATVIIPEIGQIIEF